MKIPAQNFLSGLFSINPNLLPFQLQLPFYFISFVREICNFLSSVLLQQKSEATDRPELQLSFIWQAKENTSSKHESGLIQKTQREERPMVQFWLLFLSTFFSSPKPALCKLGQPGGLFFSSEVLTLFFRPSFVPLLWAFPFHFLLATTILDSFFLFQLPNILPSRDGRPKSLEQGHQCLSGYFLLNWDRKGPRPPPCCQSQATESLYQCSSKDD